MPPLPPSTAPVYPEPQPDLAARRDAAMAQKVIRASDLLGNRQAVDIEYNGQHYRLQTTRAGKLILTK